MFRPKREALLTKAALVAQPSASARTKQKHTAKIAKRYVGQSNDEMGQRWYQTGVGKHTSRKDKGALMTPYPRSVGV